MDTVQHFNTLRDWGKYKYLSFSILTSGSLGAGPEPILTISSPITGRETDTFQAFYSKHRERGRGTLKIESLRQASIKENGIINWIS